MIANSQLSKEVYLILGKLCFKFFHILKKNLTSFVLCHPHLGLSPILNTLKYNHSSFHLTPRPPPPCLLFPKVHQFWGSTIWAELSCVVLLLVLLRITYAAIIIWQLNCHWVVWEGLIHMSSSCPGCQHHACPHGLLSPRGLDYFTNSVRTARKWQQKLQGLLRFRLRTPTMTVLPHSIGQNKKQASSD